MGAVKPNERIRQLKEAWSDGYRRRNDGLAPHPSDAQQKAIVGYLDEEAERREAFEREVLERLRELEKIFDPSPDGKRGPRLGGVQLTGYEREACEPEPEA